MNLEPLEREDDELNDDEPTLGYWLDDDNYYGHLEQQEND